jgi:hypothetical protein
VKVIKQDVYPSPFFIHAYEANTCMAGDGGAAFRLQPEFPEKR